MDEQDLSAAPILVDMTRRTLMLAPLCCAAAAAAMAGPATAEGEMPDSANSCLECDGTGIVPCEQRYVWGLGQGFAAGESNFVHGP